MRFKLVVLFIFLFFNSAAYAESIPQRYSTDSHIQNVTYNPNQVYRIVGTPGYTTAITFSDEESILSVNIGDSSAWLVNVQNNIVNLKPVSRHATTNMNVLTTRGTYEFYLTASSWNTNRRPPKNAIFLLRFRYPALHSTIQHTRTNIFNNCYSARGNARISPKSVYDDGRFTYFNFGNCKDIPAIFLVDSKGNESVLNYHVEGSYVVVETTGRQFTLRKGNLVATVFNEKQP